MLFWYLGGPGERGGRKLEGKHALLLLDWRALLPDDDAIVVLDVLRPD